MSSFVPLEVQCYSYLNKNLQRQETGEITRSLLNTEMEMKKRHDGPYSLVLKTESGSSELIFDLKNSEDSSRNKITRIKYIKRVK